MRFTLGILLLIGTSGVALARVTCLYANCAVPEMDAGLAGSGLALLAGGVLMILSRRRK